MQENYHSIDELYSLGHLSTYDSVEYAPKNLIEIYLQPNKSKYAPEKKVTFESSQPKSEPAPNKTTPPIETKSTSPEKTPPPSKLLDKKSKNNFKLDAKTQKNNHFDIDSISQRFNEVFPKTPLIKRNIKAEQKEQPLSSSPTQAIFYTTSSESLNPLFAGLYNAISDHLGPIHHIPTSSKHLLSTPTLTNTKLVIASIDAWIDIKMIYPEPQSILSFSEVENQYFLSLPKLNKISSDVSLKKETWNAIKAAFKEIND